MKTTWNLEQLYKNQNDPQIELDTEVAISKNKTFVKKWKANREYLKDPKILRAAIEEYEELEEKYGQAMKPFYYFILLNSLNQTDSNIKAKLNKLSDLYTHLSNDIQFFELNISKISEEKQKLFLTSPDLVKYKHFLEGLFLSGKYILSDSEEKVFNSMSKTSYSNWVDMLSELLDKQELSIKGEDGKTKQIHYNEISKYFESRDKKVRNFAAKEFNKINSKYAEIAEFEINSVLESKYISDTYRKVKRADLLRHIEDDIETEIVDTLVKTVTENFDISRNYYKYKAKSLGVKQLGYHDRHVPLGNATKGYQYSEAMDIVKKTFYSLDKEFGDIVERFQLNGQYDVYPQKGKSGGAFCINVSKSLPTYILLNHNMKVNDVLTIAHESGHGIHSELSKSQSAVNSDYPTSLAETASTFFEDFTLQNILETVNEEERYTILGQKMHNDVSTIFAQVALYNFETELHREFRRKGYVDRDEISELFCKHMHAYLGDSVKIDEGMRNGWIYWSHIRRYFYVYSYASGLLISKSLQAMVRENPKEISLVKTFLSSGSIKSPREIFLDMGIDISKKDIWLKGINEVKYMLDNLIKNNYG